MKTSIGIDIAKRNFVAAIKGHEKEKLKTFSNNEKGFKQFLAWVKKFSEHKCHFCMEATGKYGDKLALFLYNNKYMVSVVNPAKIKYFAKSQLLRNKTDAVDAKLILNYCELYNPHEWQPEPLEIQELQELVKRLDTLVSAELQERNRLENADEIIKESITSHIKYLQQEIKKIEEKIKNHINKYLHLKEKADLLNSIPGIGDKTTNKVLAFLGNINAYDKAKQVAAFVGLNPQQAQSGTSLNRSRLSKTGDSELRKMFYMPALTAIQFNPVIKLFYERLIAKGKPKKVAICAVMRKLVHIIYGVLKSNKPFDKQLV